MAEKEIAQHAAGLIKTHWPQLTAIVAAFLFGIRWAIGTHNKVNRIKAAVLDSDWNSKVITVGECKNCKDNSEKTQTKILSQIEKSRESQQKMAGDLATLTGSFKQFVEDHKK